MIKIKKNRMVLLIIGVIIGTLIVGAGGLYLYGSVNNIAFIKKSDYDVMKTISDKYYKLYEIQTAINEKSLWNIDEDKEMEAIYKGLVDSLGDKYSIYMNKEEVEGWKDLISGSFTGVGVTFTQDKSGNFKIIDVIEGSPAAASGLKSGDVIEKVDGKTFKDSDSMKAAIRGDEGTKVNITYVRGDESKTVSMTRAVVEERSVGSTILDGNIGYIRIAAFESGTADQFKSELADMENKGVKGLIIDIRNNGGGLTDAGIDIADMLLPECTITYMEDKNGKKQYYNSDEDCTKLPYTLLVNENTASTSEILAAAIKDNKGGKIVGTNTFGKGIVQGTINFDDGTAIKLTIMQYFSPKGKVIHGKGVAPDYIVKLGKNDKKDKQLAKAESLLK